MKKLKGITLTLVCISIFIAAVSCESTDCPINNVVYSTYGFYAATDEGESKIQVLDTLTVTAAGTDSILINRLVRGSEVELPVSYSAATDTLIFHFTDTVGRTRRDTIWIDKENIPHYESPTCRFDVPPCDRRRWTRPCRLRFNCKSNINYNVSENFKIYFRNGN